jgi:hypothetical protein
LGIAGRDRILSFGPGQGSLGGKCGIGEQHGGQDTKHKAHDHSLKLAVSDRRMLRQGSDPQTTMPDTARTANVQKRSGWSMSAI